MSDELKDFSEQIDEQFDIADMQSVESDDFWEAIANLFIWFAGLPTPIISVISNDSERSYAPMLADFTCCVRFLFRPNTHPYRAQSKWHSFQKLVSITFQHSNFPTFQPKSIKTVPLQPDE